MVEPVGAGTSGALVYDQAIEAALDEVADVMAAALDMDALFALTWTSSDAP